MTNQTIDGVPRELLLWLDDFINDGLALTAEEESVSAQLRALLDAAPRCPGCGYTEQDCREQMDHHLCGLPEPAKPSPIRFSDLPAAQPRGEPVRDDSETLSYKLEYLGPISRCDVACGSYGDKFHRWDDAGPYVEYEDHLKYIEAYKGEIDYLKNIIANAEQPAPVAVVMSFDFEHPSSKERRTVALSKQDVFDGMEDYFYDKIGEQICRCESVGETNVVDCSCDEYVHDFEIVKASLTS